MGNQMRELGLRIDRVCSLLSPNKIAERLGRSVSQISARRMEPRLKTCCGCCWYCARFPWY